MKYTQRSWSTRVLAATAVSVLFAAGHQASAQTAGPQASQRAGVVSLTCSPFYLPARSIWPRTVAIELDGDGVRAIEIDGVAAHTFNVNGTVILTAVDGERIQIDMAALTWSSDLRGIVSGRGSCTR